MIPKATQDRVYNAFPDAFQFRYQDPATGTAHVGEFDLMKKWADEGEEPDQQVYHLLMLNLSPTGVVRPDANLSLGPSTRLEGTPTTIEYLYNTPVYDELNLTLVVKGNHGPTGTTPRERMGQLLPFIRRYVQYEFPQEMADDALATDVPDARISVPRQNVGSADDVSGLVGDEDVVRYSITLRLSYSLTYLDEVDEVAGLNIDLKGSMVDDPTRIEIRFEHTPE